MAESTRIDITELSSIDTINSAKIFHNTVSQFKELRDSSGNDNQDNDDGDQYNDPRTLDDLIKEIESYKERLSYQHLEIVTKENFLKNIINNEMNNLITNDAENKIFELEEDNKLKLQKLENLLDEKDKIKDLNINLSYDIISKFNNIENEINSNNSIKDEINELINSIKELENSNKLNNIVNTNENERDEELVNNLKKLSNFKKQKSDHDEDDLSIKNYDDLSTVTERVNEINSDLINEIEEMNKQFNEIEYTKEEMNNKIDKLIKFKSELNSKLDYYKNNNNTSHTDEQKDGNYNKENLDNLFEWYIELIKLWLNITDLSQLNIDKNEKLIEIKFKNNKIFNINYDEDYNFFYINDKIFQNLKELVNYINYINF
ncbi:unnamed protein product [[Candida] boidinii]|uniref:Unnamed protein product n=1 Tax=Candida boidinii TaxID=5477 RepID=A0A9W6SWY8_CANBO|nr:hypothetical protein B5S30_g713 [[Candida] boidinii]GME66637.1 unnamed protein product [[Candida] boidinii]